MNKEIFQNRVDFLPSIGKPNQIYYVPNGQGTDLDHYVADNNGVLRKVNPVISSIGSETDPVFSSWLSTPPNISIFNNDAGYLVGDYLPLSGGTMTGPIFFGTGGQNLNRGSFDNATGGDQGISLNCAVGYELNWQGGHLSSSMGTLLIDNPIQINSNTIIYNSEIKLGDIFGSAEFDAGVDGGAYLRLKTGGEGVGKVWTSDVNGWGSWETPTSSFSLTDGNATTANGTAVDLGGVLSSNLLITTVSYPLGIFAVSTAGSIDIGDPFNSINGTHLRIDDIIQNVNLEAGSFTVQTSAGTEFTTPLFLINGVSPLFGTAITGATKTKITYNSDGLITSGVDATTADIADSINKRYVTDAQLTVIGNTSGTNTGDQTTISGNAGTATTLQTARAINGTNFDGSAAITITAAAGTLTGATLASGVTVSSLTSFGTSPTLVTPLLGTPTSGNLANCTFPTLNQNTTGTANIAGGTAGAIPYQSAANTTTVLAATVTANKVLMSGSSAAPVWSTPTFPNASATNRKKIVSDGTNWVASTETWAVPGSSGNVLTSDGTNWTSTALSANTTTIGGFNAIFTGLGRYSGTLIVGSASSIIASAQMEVVSTTKGFAPPRMTTTQKNAIVTPAEGLIVYDLTLHKLCVYTGSAWEIITSI